MQQRSTLRDRPLRQPSGLQQAVRVGCPIDPRRSNVAVYMNISSCVYTLLVSTAEATAQASATVERPLNDHDLSIARGGSLVTVREQILRKAVPALARDRKPA